MITDATIMAASARCDELLELVGPLSELDYALLAVACADQAGVPVATLGKVAGLLTLTMPGNTIADRVMILAAAKPITMAMRYAQEAADSEARADLEEQRRYPGPVEP